MLHWRWCISGSNYFVSLSPSLHAGSIADEGELSTVCYRPEGLDRLVQQTKFSKKELQVLYRGFKNVSNHWITMFMNMQCLNTIDVCLWIYFFVLEKVCVTTCGFSLVDIIFFWFPKECPSGVVNEETFKNIYSQFFPQGGQSDSLPVIHLTQHLFYQQFSSRSLNVGWSLRNSAQSKHQYLITVSL